MGWAVRALKARGGIQQSRHMGRAGPAHYAFLVSEAEFDEIVARITERGLDYWADPFHRQPNAINTNDGGRSVYWDDPNGIILEIITRPYGSGGQARPASHSGGGRPIGSHISTTLTRAPAATLRDQNVGAEVVDVKEFELAIGHLRMPEMA